MPGSLAARPSCCQAGLQRSCLWQANARPAAVRGTTHWFVMRLQVRTEAEARVQQLRTAQDEEQQLTAQEKRKVGPCQPA